MLVMTSLRVLGLAAVAATAVLVTGCGGTTTTSPPPASTSASPAPSLSAADLAWIQAISKLHQQTDKPFQASSINMTRAKMHELANALRSCKRELSQLGSPGVLLQPANDLVQQACRTYRKGGRCFAKAASVSDAAGAVLAGSAEDRIQRRALACGFAAQGNGSNLMTEAEAKAAEIRARYQ